MFNSRQAIAVYRGWAELEDRLPEDKSIEVIDFDLVPEITDAESFESRAEVMTRLKELHAGTEPTEEISEFIRAKLAASIHYLRCLEGESFEFYAHVRNILGISPEFISEGEIDQQKRRVLDLLGSLGLSANEDGDIPGPEFLEFDDRIRIGRDAAEAQSKQDREHFGQVLNRGVEFEELDPPPYQLKIADVDAYWRGWTSGKRGEFLLQFNFHPTHRWRQGDMEFLTVHEVCGHLVHAESLAREIAAGRLDPFVGITTVHDPHGFMGEGIADALTYFFPEEIKLSSYGALAAEQYKWRDYLNNNAHILVNMGWDRDLLMAYQLVNPFTTAAGASRNLGKWQTDPLWRAYQYSYGISRKYHEVFAAKMTHRQKIEYLRYAFTRYVTPKRLIEHAERLLETG